MVFSSPIFLFWFLPAVLFTYAVLDRRLKNFFLLLGSLFFYAWGEPTFVLIMLGSILGNYLFGLGIGRASGLRRRKLALGLGVTFNLAMLAAFKYANFLADNLNVVWTRLGGAAFEVDPVPLPLGISFFTFQAMSYVIEVYKGEVSSQKNPITLALYISLFPQLIAGPIVRYHDIARELTNRSVRLQDAVDGVRRFVVGLGKKVLIANPLGAVADQIFAIPPDQVPTSFAWLGVVCYALQIYFDFSGYSDMAIGLGRLFGFHFLENFNYPYISQSITEFWRRWHISLSTWFRDYLYIPLGGDRRGRARTYFILVLVFFLCGLWHGANWTFVVWGLFNGAFLVIERAGFGAVLERLPRAVRHGYVVLVFLTAWVFFRSETIGGALLYLRAMFLGGGELPYTPLYLLSNDVLAVLAVGIVASTPIALKAAESVREWQSRTERPATVLLGRLAEVAALPIVSGIFLLSAARLASGTYNPFIYFRF